MTSDLPQDERNEFVFENDSLRISYGFISNGSLRVVVQNKLDKLIYVDWSKSSIIMSGENIASFSKNLTLNASANNYEILGQLSSDINGEITQPMNISYIQPQSYITNTSKPIPFKFKDFNPDAYFEQIEFGYGKAKKYVFDNDKENHITSFVYINQIDESKPSVISQDFWASQLNQSLESNIPLKPDQFVKTSPTALGQTMMFFGGTSILILAAVVASGEE